MVLETSCIVESFNLQNEISSVYHILLHYFFTESLSLLFSCFIDGRIQISG